MIVILRCIQNPRIEEMWNCFRLFICIHSISCIYIVLLLVK